MISIVKAVCQWFPRFRQACFLVSSITSTAASYCIVQNIRVTNPGKASPVSSYQVYLN